MKKLPFLNRFLIALLLVSLSFSSCRQENDLAELQEINAKILQDDSLPNPLEEVEAYHNRRSYDELWVTDQGLNTVTAFDTRTMRVERTIDISRAGASKPHMVFFSPDGKFAYVACVGGDGATVVIRTRDYKVLTTLATGKSSHAAVPNIDGTQVLVAVIGEKKIKEITVNARTESFFISREIDLAAALPDRTQFPNNTPICPLFTTDGTACYVTLGGGGMAILDAASLEVIKAHPVSAVAPAGCGLVNGPPKSNFMFSNSGTVGSGSFYIFDKSNHDLVKTVPTGADGLDAHGVGLAKFGKRVWVVNRLSDNIKIYDISAGKFVQTIPNIGDAPDLLVFSGNGSRAYITTRGPNPSTGTHAISGQNPGVLIMDAHRKKVIKHIALGDRERSDPHGIAVLTKKIISPF